MEIKVLFSKNWQIISMIHHLFGPPYSLMRHQELSSALFLFSKEFHSIYKLKRILEGFQREDLYKIIWELSPLGEGRVPKKIRDILRKIRVYGWKEIKRTLDEKSRKLEKFFNENIERAKELISKTFSINDFPEEFYVFISYKYQGAGGIGLPSKYPAVSIMTNETIKKEKDFDLFLHEFLHWLFNKSGIHKVIKEKLGKEKSLFEESFLDYFCPRGLLSKKLGLVESLEKLQRGRPTRYEWYKDWFEKLRVLLDYNFSEDVWNFLERNIKDSKIKEVCREIKRIL